MPRSKRGRDVIHLCGGWSPDSYPTKSVAPIKQLPGGHVDGIKFDFIRDEEAKKFESIQKIPFLFTGRIPQEGMRTETAVVVKGIKARFSGIITVIHPPPTRRELKCLSRPFSCGCRRRTCKFKNGIKRTFGADHGQRISGVAVLNFDFYDKMKRLVDPNRVYQVEYQLESNMDHVWIGVAAERVDVVDIDELRNEIWPSWRMYGACCPPKSAPNARTLATLTGCLGVFETANCLLSETDGCMHDFFISEEQYLSHAIYLLNLEIGSLSKEQITERDREDLDLVRRLIEVNLGRSQCLKCSRSVALYLLNHLPPLYWTASHLPPAGLILKYLVEKSSQHFQLARMIFSKSEIGRCIFMHDLNSDGYLHGTFAVNVYRWRRRDWRHMSRLYKGGSSDIVLGMVMKVARLCGEGWTSYYQNADTQSVTNKLFTIHMWFVILVFAMRRLRYDVSRAFRTSEIKLLFDREGGLNVDIEEDDGLFRWIRDCTTMLFHADDTRNYNSFYHTIKEYSTESRDMLRESSKCSNSKCSVWVPDCKYVCAKCRCGIYCSRRCQKYDWNRGEHRLLCKQTKFA